MHGELKVKSHSNISNNSEKDISGKKKLLYCVVPSSRLKGHPMTSLFDGLWSLSCTATSGPGLGLTLCIHFS